MGVIKISFIITCWRVLQQPLAGGGGGWGVPYLFLFLVGFPGLADLLLPLLQLPLFPLTLVLALVFHNLLSLPHTHITHTVLGPATGQSTGSWHRSEYWVLMQSVYWVLMQVSVLGPDTCQCWDLIQVRVLGPNTGQCTGSWHRSVYWVLTQVCVQGPDTCQCWDLTHISILGPDARQHTGSWHTSVYWVLMQVSIQDPNTSQCTRSLHKSKYFNHPSSVNLTTKDSLI